MLRLFHRNENSSNVVWEPWVHYVLCGRTWLPKCLTFECKPKFIAWTLFLQHQYQHQLPMTFGVCHTWYSCSTNTKPQNPAMNSLQIAWIDMLNCLLKKKSSELNSPNSFSSHTQSKTNLQWGSVWFMAHLEHSQQEHQFTKAMSSLLRIMC